MTRNILGALDLSLAGLGVVCGPTDWDGDFKRLHSASFGVSLKKHASSREVTMRLINLCRDVRTWLIRHGVGAVVAERLPTHGRHLGPLGELHGCMRRELLVECGLDLEFIKISTARTLLYGLLPPRGLTPTQRKRWLVEPVRAAGGRFDDHDQTDAFCVWNAAVADFGGYHLKHLLGSPEPKKSKRTKRPRTFTGATLDDLTLGSRSTADERLAIVNRMVDLGVLGADEMPTLLQGNAAEEARRIRAALQHAKAAGSKAKRSKRKVAA